MKIKKNTRKSKIKEQTEKRNRKRNQTKKLNTHETQK